MKSVVEQTRICQITRNSRLDKLSRSTSAVQLRQAGGFWEVTVR